MIETISSKVSHTHLNVFLVEDSMLQSVCYGTLTKYYWGLIYGNV